MPVGLVPAPVIVQLPRSDPDSVYLNTLSVLLASLSGSYAPYPGPIYAASTLLTLPVLIVFWFFRKSFTAGISFVFR